MASNDSGLDTSNDSSSAPDTSIINLRQMEQSIANYVTIMEPPFGISRSYADIREASGDDYERPRNTSVPIRYRCRRRDDKYERDRSSRVGLNVPYSTIYTKENRLRMAASVCNTELLDRLLEAGVNPDAADEHSRSPLHISASRGESNPDTSVCTNHTVCTCMFSDNWYIFSSGYTQIVKSLLAHGANPNAQDTLGNTPLHLAVCSASSYNFNKVGYLSFICDQTKTKRCLPLLEQAKKCKDNK